MGAYKLVIGFNPDQNETNTYDAKQYLLLDVVDNKRVNGKSTIASQPIQSGDVISDHMYRNPITYSISGKFGLYGNNYDDTGYGEAFGLQGDRLTNIEETFERIKNEGILCTLVTMECNADTGKIDVSNSSTRFKIRRNMALESFSWEEKHDTIVYNLDFYEIIMVDAQTEYNADPNDQVALSLPNVSYPKGSSLSAVLSDTGNIESQVIKVLYDNGYLSDAFIKEICMNSENVPLYANLQKVLAVVGVGAAIAGGVAIALSAGVTGTVLAGAAAGIASTGVGLIVVAAVALVAGVVLAIVQGVKEIKAEIKAKKVFDIRNGSAEQDAERLNQLLLDVKAAVNKIKSNSTVYQLSSNEEQQVLLKISGIVHSINFVKNNVSNEWDATVSRLDNKSVESCKNFRYKTNFANLKKTEDCWFTANNGTYQVYVLNPSADESMPNSNAAKENLTNYLIIVSKGDITDTIKRISQVVVDVISERGYK